VKRFLRDEVNNPTIKRRHSHHAYLKIPKSKKRLDEEDVVNEGELPSMFDENVIFDEYLTKKEEKR